MVRHHGMERLSIIADRPLRAALLSQRLVRKTCDKQTYAFRPDHVHLPALLTTEQTSCAISQCCQFSPCPYCMQQFPIQTPLLIHFLMLLVVFDGAITAERP